MIMSKQDTLCILGNGSHWSGLLELQGSARVESDFHGDIRMKGELVIGPEAEVRGTLTVGALEVFGRIVGDVVVERRLVLRKGAIIDGDIYAPRLESEDGARFNGKICMSGGPNVARSRADLLARPDHVSSRALPELRARNA